MPNYSKFLKEDIQAIREMADSKMSTSEIGSHFGKTAKSIQKVYVRYGIKGLPSGGQFGSRNSSWNGGITFDKSGYILQRFPGHPFASSSGYVRQHRLVMENHLKRYLLPNEVVHHIDGNKQNNNFENLELFSSNGEHLKMELSGKCPNWSPEGIKKLQKSRAKAVLARRSSTSHS